MHTEFWQMQTSVINFSGQNCTSGLTMDWLPHWGENREHLVIIPTLASSGQAFVAPGGRVKVWNITPACFIFEPVWEQRKVIYLMGTLERQTPLNNLSGHSLSGHSLVKAAANGQPLFASEQTKQSNQVRSKNQMSWSFYLLFNIILIW